MPTDYDGQFFGILMSQNFRKIANLGFQRRFLRLIHLP
jgi:hypothetical protein